MEQMKILFYSECNAAAEVFKASIHAKLKDQAGKYDEVHEPEVECVETTATSRKRRSVARHRREETSFQIHIKAAVTKTHIEEEPPTEGETSDTTDTSDSNSDTGTVLYPKNTFCKSLRLAETAS